MAQLKGKVALVTGAGRGLGQACAMLLAREGAKLVIAEFDEATGQDSAAQICAAGGEALFVRTDISRAEDVRGMVDFAMSRFGKLDCAVNNAMRGMAAKPLADIAPEEWDQVMAVNFRGMFLSMKYEIAAMVESGGGSIVNIGSGNEHTAEPGLSWYLSAKQAVYGMTKVAALDYATKGIRINAVAPGPMWTPALRERAAQNAEHAARRAAHVPLGRIAEPEEVAQAVLWLCSPASSYVLGHTLAADGGYVLG